MLTDVVGKSYPLVNVHSFLGLSFENDRLVIELVALMNIIQDLERRIFHGL